MNIVLVGFMGCGKTTVGKQIAKKLHYQFIDTDIAIEDEQGCSISEIFTYQGEAYFRELETKYLKKCLTLQNTILSTGGGIVTTPGNMKLLQQIGSVVYLKTSKEVILERVLRNNSRPLVRKENPEQVVETLMQERAPLYEQANHILETANTLPREVAAQVLKCLFEDA